MRNLKALGLVLIVLGGAGAMAAPAAMATPEFTAFNVSALEDPSEASIHGTQLGEGHEFTAGSGAVKCKTATFTGTLTGPASSTLALGATYAECKGFFGEAADVAMNGCEFLFHTEAETGENEYSATVDLSCPVSKEPTITTTTEGGGAKCTLRIESGQKGLGSVHIAEVEGKMEFQMALEGIAYVSEGGFFNCGVTNGTHTNGGYHGNSTVSASKGETSLYLQMADGDLVADPVSFSKKVTEIEKVKLSSKSSDAELLIVSESGQGDGVFKLTKKCSGKKVTCTAELECEKEGDTLYEVLGLTGDNKYTLTKVGVQCTK